MVSITTVVVKRIRPHLIKVAWPSGYHLVAGGRLVVSKDADTYKQYPDMPEYTKDMFPVPFNSWQDGEHPEVDVTIVDRGSKHAGPIAAQNGLFTLHSIADIRSWLNDLAKE